ncbi:hypothetical protein GCM10007094_23270 [Pseudovibrio japonicus]|uniref:ParB/Sulfiredoxin domain-containing protein n=1 Tax=Pseudovibrio japonicus TaxID=366534 RepID=A0ABQ3ECZ2_9HYPH|nr:DUF6551 family protein [Pseudovibrio japonicus]GHB33762.1 hypothetical protein GCM10007094_23270 [Pseudovibrio japonicus]
MSKTTRQIQALNLPDVAAGYPGALPEFTIVDPTSLFVDEEYQRNLSRSSVRLIRKIVKQWNWNSFKPPIAVQVDGQLHLLDGQHTAIAAATHPEITEVPVMVVPAETTAERASAFVRHNQNRLNVTSMQLFYSQLAAGENDATSVHMAMERAGVTLLKSQPPKGMYKAGDTLAATTLLKVVRRRYVIGLRRILVICKKAGLKPISADAIKAVEMLLFSEDYAGQIDEERLVLTIMKEGESANGEVAALKAAHSMLTWRAMAAIWFKKTRKKRK